MAVFRLLVIDKLYHGLNLRANGFFVRMQFHFVVKSLMKRASKTIFDPRYDRIISDLVKLRRESGFTQRSFSAKTGYSKCFIGRVETKERRLDFIETIDYMKHLGLSKTEIAVKTAEWMEAFL